RFPSADSTQILVNYQVVRNEMAMSAWTGQGDDADFALKLRALVRTYGEGSVVTRAANLLNVQPATLRDAWNSRQGRRIIRQSVFHELPCRDYQFQQLFLVSLGVIRSGAISAMTAAEEELIMAGGQALFNRHHAGQLNLVGLWPLLGAWKGNLGFL